MITSEQPKKIDDGYQPQNIILDHVTILRYVQEFGEERAVGYIDAVKDFNVAIKQILGPGFAYDGIPKPCPKIKKEVISLYHSNDDLINKFALKNNSKSDFQPDQI